MNRQNTPARDFDGKTAIVTGGAMGIGLACAQKMVDGGAQVVLADVDVAAGEQGAEQLGDAARFVETDMGDMRAVERLARLTLEHYGRIDVLVNNAARALNGVVDEIEEDRWNAVINTNLTGYWRAMRVCVPSMREQGSGSVVNLSSVQGLRGFRGWAAYAAAKGAINSLTVQSAVDLAPQGIRVNAVVPGTILTPLNEKLFESMEDPSELIDTWNRAHPLGRFGQPEEVAEAVVFLASERASFITGELLRVDGGLAIKGE